MCGLNPNPEPIPPMDRASLRIIDANANRAAEGLRVAEEFARLALDNEQYTRVLKDLRHELRQVIARLAPQAQRLNARNIEGDVGTEIFGPGESARANLHAVAASAFGRVKESLRVLEEVAKIEDPECAKQIEGFRYLLYGCESKILGAAHRREVIENARLYLILTESLCKHSLEDTLRAAISGGVDIVQLREKELLDAAYLSRARDVQLICREFEIPFIVNDRADVAAIMRADGVHIGQDDLSVGFARDLLGPATLLGLSTHNREQLESSDASLADYLGVGPAYATATKPHEPEAGLAFLREASERALRPWFAIGGINAERIDAVLAAGATRIAVSRAICSADDPEKAAAALAERLNV